MIGIGLWRFWPTHQPVAENLPITLGPGVSTWFTRVETVEAKPSQVTLRAHLTPTFQAGVQESRIVFLTYSFLGHNGELFSATTPCELRPRESFTTLVLENPKRVSARGIGLSLAH